MKHLLFVWVATFCSLTAFAQENKSTRIVIQNQMDTNGKVVQIAVPTEEAMQVPRMAATEQTTEMDNLPKTLDSVDGVVVSRHMTPEEAQRYKLRAKRRAEAEDNHIFVSNTEEGVAMTFKVLSENEKTCQVGVGEGNSAGTSDAAIDRNYDGVVTIPSEAKGYTVVQIGNGAFYYCTNVKGINLPNTIKNINFCAFNDCRSLTSLFIPASVEYIHTFAAGGIINMEVIEVDPANSVYDSRNNCNAIIKTSNVSLVVGCKMTNIFEGVKEIGSGAFTECTSLTAVHIPSTVTYIGGQAFQYCRNLATITVASNNAVLDSRDNCNAIIKTSTNELWVGSTMGTIPASVTGIRYYAFSGRDNMGTVTIPKDVASIGNYAFAYNKGMDKVMSWIPVPFDVDEKTFYGSYDNTPLYVPKDTKSDYQSKIGWGLFKTITEMDENGNPIEDETEFEAETVEGVTMKFKVLDTEMKTCQAGLIENSTSSSSSDACVSTSTTGTITIPATVKGYTVVKIAQSAFYGVYKATQIIIPNTIESIGDFAFSSCNSMPEINIPASVTKLSNYALANATGRTKITVDKANPVYDSRDNSNAVIETASNKLVFGCATTIIPESVEAIGHGAFFGCSDAKSFVIPKKVQNFGSQSFSYCYNLETLTVADSNPTFDSRDNCNAVIETATNKVVKMGALSFIPKDATTIAYHALEGNSMVEKLEIPAGVTTIEDCALYNCHNLYQVISHIKTPFVISDNAITNGYQDYPEFLYVPAGTKALYKETPSWNLFTNIEELGSETTIEIEPLPDNTSNFSEDLTGDEDLSNTEVDNILFTLNQDNGDGYDSTEGCIIVNTTMKQDEIDALDMSQVGTPEFAAQFTGMVIAVKAGRGSISIDMQSLGSHALGVKIGGGASVKLTHVSRDVIAINYNVAEDTYVLIYAIASDDSAVPMRGASVDDNSLKIYSVAWNHTGDYDATLGIETVKDSENPVNDQPVVYSLDGRYQTLPAKGVVIINGKKVIAN